MCRWNNNNWNVPHTRRRRYTHPGGSDSGSSPTGAGRCTRNHLGKSKRNRPAPVTGQNICGWVTCGICRFLPCTHWSPRRRIRNLGHPPCTHSYTQGWYWCKRQSDSSGIGVVQLRTRRNLKRGNKKGNVRTAWVWSAHFSFCEPFDDMATGTHVF